MEQPISHRCIYSGDVITPENNSAAHVFPNAIGGRLKPKNILTRKSNFEISKRIENDFLEIFKGLLSMIDPVRDRGHMLRHQHTSSLNEKYVQSRGAVFLEHVRDEVHPPNHRYLKHSIIFGDRPVIKRVQEFDWCIILPALYVFSNIFAAFKGVQIPQTFKDFVDNPALVAKFAPIQLCTLSKNFIRNEDSIRHTVVIGHDEHQKSTYVYIEIFGIISAWTFLPYNSQVKFSGYSVDIVTGSHSEFPVAIDFFKGLDLVATKDQYLEQVVYPKFLRLLSVIRDIQFRRFVVEVLRFACAGKFDFEFQDRLENAYDLIERKYNELQNPWIFKN
ncbi:hypothetical protein SOM61_22450 [Massilia sp. CFBP9012]|uniref:hypothetical protein n=1 Tax=Massilia sp. CFBP9012 TaxID=3096531 RepID=UPI002A6AFEF3|nr:hypothetical protein [Massilia sp. CFBP9012]MDY0977727.1 hypothetical protein [Massilia sp. CFBP9012]